MRVVVIDGPAPAVSLEEAKRHLRIFETDGGGAPLPGEDDTYVEALIAAAQGHIDGPAGRLGRAVGVQTLELLADAWPRRLPCRPVIEVISATIEGEDIAGVIVEPDGLVRGAPCDARGSIRIRYRAGYGQWRGEGGGRELVTVAPAPLKQAILLMVGHWFANREAVVTGTIATEIPMAVETLLWPYHLRVA